MYKRRTLLQSTAAGTALGLGVLTGSDSAAAAKPVTDLGNGVNLQAGYTRNTTTGQEPPVGWDLMAQQSTIETVRIEIEPPDKNESSFGLEGYKNLIREANDAGLDVIATYHHWPYNGGNDSGTNRESLRAAGDWWAANYADLSDAGDFTVNLINEWGPHGVDPNDIGKWYKAEIEKLRDAGYDGQVVVDCTGYAQDVYDTVEGLEAWLDWEDIAIGVHVYGKASPNRGGNTMEPSDLDVVANSSFPGIIGEFGTRLNWDDRQNTDVASVVDYARDTLGWPVLAWAWNGDGEDWPMNMTQPAWDAVDYSVPESQSYDLNLDCNGGDGYFNEMHALLGGSEQNCDGERTVPDGTYKVVNVNSGKVIDVQDISTDRGADVHQWTWQGSDNQKWQVSHQGNGEYRFEAVHSGKVADGNASSENNVHQWEWHGGDNQRWFVDDVDGDGYRIREKATGDVMDVYGAGTSDGDTISTYGWHGGGNQRFRFVALDGDDGDDGGGIAAPTNLRTDDVSDSHIIVSWDRNGGSKYEVVFENQRTGYSDNGYVTDTSTARISNLESLTEYEIRVAAVTSNDGREWSESITEPTDYDWGWSR